MKLAIYITATTGYCHALKAQARKVVAALNVNNHKIDQILIMIVGDRLEPMLPAIRIYEEGLKNAEISPIVDKRFGTGYENYKTEAQLLIAQMRQEASYKAISWGADYCLSLDCDVLPPPNSIRTMIDVLNFDNNHYSVSFCPYPSHGGGSFLGGHGTQSQPILPDFYEDEKDVPEDLLNLKKELEKDIPKNIHELHSIHEKIKSLPPIGNVFKCNAKKWRRRGWFDFAYPGIGRGAIVPIDWTGFGCTMMNREALALCDWTGYDGRGTEDLFINFKRWEPNGIRMACIPHCPCDHVVRHPTRKGEYVHIMTGHELTGEHRDHLRQIPVPWYSQEPGERSRAENDGSLNRNRIFEEQLMLPF